MKLKYYSRITISIVTRNTSLREYHKREFVGEIKEVMRLCVFAYDTCTSNGPKLFYLMITNYNHQI
jgi:hypothetical protein